MPQETNGGCQSGTDPQPPMGREWCLFMHKNPDGFASCRRYCSIATFSTAPYRSSSRERQRFLLTVDSDTEGLRVQANGDAVVSASPYGKSPSALRTNIVDLVRRRPVGDLSGIKVHHFGVAAPHRGNGPVESIADNGVAKVREMLADLVRSPGEGNAFDDGFAGRIVRAAHGEGRQGWPEAAQAWGTTFAILASTLPDVPTHSAVRKVLLKNPRTAIIIHLCVRP